MLEVVWLLAAIELNGARISRGAQVAITDTHCLIETVAVSSALTPSMLRDHDVSGVFTIAPQRCSFDAAENLLRVRLPQEALGQRTLMLSPASGNLSVALLHDQTALIDHPEFASQPMPETIPSAAFDVFLGSGLRGLGTVLAHGPWSLQRLSQQGQGGQRFDRTTGEYFFAQGAQIRVGDFRSERGADQLLGEYRGAYATNRAAPLRGDGKAEAFLAVSNPSRVQFFDRNGTPVYSSEILPPGNYQIQGYGASTVPGFLEARLIDVNGITQSVSLPWSADRRLLSQHQLEWEVFHAAPRQLSGTLGDQTLTSLSLRRGMSSNVTLGLHADWSADGRRWAVEASTRAIPSLIATGAVGRSCGAFALSGGTPQGESSCTPTWLLEARSKILQSSSLIASVSRASDPLTGLAPTLVAQLGLSGALSQQFSGALTHAISQPDQGAAQHVTTLSGSYRLHPQASLQFQARRHLTDEGQAWSGFLGLSFYWSTRRTSISTALNHRAATNGNAASNSLTLQAGISPEGPYGAQLNVAHTADTTPRSDAFLRYANRQGDVSLRADTQTARTTWSASSRLWVTTERITLAPTGDDNLVIQHLGLPDIRVIHQGRDPEVAGANGLVVFRKAPPWTETRYTIDPKSIPFGYHLAASSVRIPLAANRAYSVDYRPLWTRSQTWKISNLEALDLAIDRPPQSQEGRPVFMTPDGYLDLQSETELPLTLHDRLGRRLICVKPAESQPLDAEISLRCSAPAVL
jgi:hypothetical protein